jgi:hypothetical protein
MVMIDKIKEIFKDEKIVVEKTSDTFINFYLYTSLFEPGIQSSKIRQLEELTGDTDIVIIPKAKYVFNFLIDIKK